VTFTPRRQSIAISGDVRFTPRRRPRKGRPTLPRRCSVPVGRQERCGEHVHAGRSTHHPEKVLSTVKIAG